MSSLSYNNGYDTIALVDDLVDRFNVITFIKTDIHLKMNSLSKPEIFLRF